MSKTPFDIDKNWKMIQSAKKRAASRFIEQSLQDPKKSSQLYNQIRDE